MSEYLTVREYASDEFTEKKSKFIGHIKPVENEEEALEFINEIRSKYHDATHNVFAYVLRDNNLSRASDDSEPQGTAGVPVLNVIKGSGLTNVCIVVTRYFGGILLGTGGLVKAYTEGAKIAVEASSKKCMALTDDISITSDYDLYGKIEHYIQDKNIMVLQNNFGENVSTSVRVRSEDFEKLQKDICEITSARAEVSRISTGWNEIE